MTWNQRFLAWLDTTNFRNRDRPVYWKDLLRVWENHETNEPKNYWDDLKSRRTDWFFTEEPTQTTIYISRPGEFKSFTGTSKEAAAHLAILHLDTYL